MPNPRKAGKTRTTKETNISLELDLDNFFEGNIASGSGFLDHMLTLFSKHSGIGMSLECKGDTQVDMHHSCEDIGISLGECIADALKDKKGIERYGFYYVPMDESLVRVVLDLSGRIAFSFTGKIRQKVIGNFDSELVPHFFESIAQSAKMNLHIDLIRGDNTHHCIEGIFKAFARALAMAISPSARVKGVPSTKGLL